MSKGVTAPRPLTDNEVNETRNLKKKVEFMKDQLNHDPSIDVGTISSQGHSHTESDDDDEDDQS